MPETSTCWLPKLQFNLALEQNVLFQKTLIQLNLYCAMPWQDEGQPLPCPRGQHTLSWGVGPTAHGILSLLHPSLEDHSLLPLAQPCHLCQPSPEGPNACLPPAPTQQHLLNWVSNDSIKQAWKEGWPRRAPAYPTGEAASSAEPWSLCCGCRESRLLAAQEPTCTSWTCSFKANYFGGGSGGDQAPGLACTRPMFFDCSIAIPKTDHT